MNRHLQFTHGYGVVLSPANAVTPEGDPQLIVKDLPPTGDIKIDQPGIYFGENLDGYVIVDTEQQEIDFPRPTARTGRAPTRATAASRSTRSSSGPRFALRFGDSTRSSRASSRTSPGRSTCATFANGRGGRAVPHVRQRPLPGTCRGRAARTGSSGCRTPTRPRTAIRTPQRADGPAADCEWSEHVVQLRAQLGEGRHRRIQRDDDVLRLRSQGPDRRRRTRRLSRSCSRPRSEMSAELRDPPPLSRRPVPRADQHVRPLPHHRTGRLLQQGRRVGYRAGSRLRCGRYRRDDADNQRSRDRRPVAANCAWTPTTCSCACRARCRRTS